jgi:uncharacterized membrane protein YeaQ/YmgE (transglycosylase-associated protein family)
MTFTIILGWLVTGLVIGGLAHLLVPGRNRIGIIRTLVVGIVGALAGGLITAALLGTGHLIITFLVALVVAALLIATITRSSGRRLSGRRPSVRRRSGRRLLRW